LIKQVSRISDIRTETIAEYTQHGWMDEEIVENLSDAINFLNSRFHCLNEVPDQILECFIFSENEEEIG
jgi:hypothetical protein